MEEREVLKLKPLVASRAAVNKKLGLRVGFLKSKTSYKDIVLFA